MVYFGVGTRHCKIHCYWAELCNNISNQHPLFTNVKYRGTDNVKCRLPILQKYDFSDRSISSAVKIIYFSKKYVSISSSSISRQILTRLLWSCKRIHELLPNILIHIWEENKTYWCFSRHYYLLSQKFLLFGELPL